MKIKAILNRQNTSKLKKYTARIILKRYKIKKKNKEFQGFTKMKVT